MATTSACAREYAWPDQHCGKAAYARKNQQSRTAGVHLSWRPSWISWLLSSDAAVITLLLVSIQQAHVCAQHSMHTAVEVLYSCRR